MARPTTRNEHSEYCLRKLGKPVLNINVAPEQIEDRIDEALEMFVDYHYDATTESWVSYTVAQADIDNGYITLPDDILTVVEVMDISAQLNYSGMFTYQYQTAVGALSPWQSFDSVDYFMKMSNYQQTKNMIDAAPRFEYIRHGNRLKIYEDLAVGVQVGLKVYSILDKTEITKIWDDAWLKKYSTALIKRQWAENVSKFENIQLLGGVTINGERLMSEALQDIERLEEEIKETYSWPTDFLIG